MLIRWGYNTVNTSITDSQGISAVVEQLLLEHEGISPLWDSCEPIVVVGPKNKDCGRRMLLPPGELHFLQACARVQQGILFDPKCTVTSEIFAEAFIRLGSFIEARNRERERLDWSPIQTPRGRQ